jgi:peroxiredoxin
VHTALRRLRGAWLIVALTVTACGSTASAGAVTAPVGSHSGDTAPALSGTSLEGHSLSLASLRGSVVVIVFWASWCAPCQAEQPAVNTLAQKETGGVRFLGVSVDVDRAAARSYITRFEVPYDSLDDTGQTIVVDYEVAGPPTTFVIDKRGRVSAELVGEVNVVTLRERITAALSSH